MFSLHNKKKCWVCPAKNKDALLQPAKRSACSQPFISGSPSSGRSVAPRIQYSCNLKYAAHMQMRSFPFVARVDIGYNNRTNLLLQSWPTGIVISCIIDAKEERAVWTWTKLNNFLLMYRLSAINYSRSLLFDFSEPFLS